MSSNKKFEDLDDYQKKLLSMNVHSTEFHKIGKKTTVALLTTFKGFEVVGTSACIDPKDFDQEIGEHYALVDALHKLDELYGFLRQHMS